MVKYLQLLLLAKTIAISLLNTVHSLFRLLCLKDFIRWKKTVTPPGTELAAH